MQPTVFSMICLALRNAEKLVSDKHSGVPVIDISSPSEITISPVPSPDGDLQTTVGLTGLLLSLSTLMTSTDDVE